MKYEVKITEILERTVTIEADSKEDAVNKAEAQYAAGEILLDSSHFVDFKMEAKDA